MPVRQASIRQRCQSGRQNKNKVHSTFAHLNFVVSLADACRIAQHGGIAGQVEVHLDRISCGARMHTHQSGLSFGDMVQQ
jgi:hypothetical protein